MRGRYLVPLMISVSTAWGADFTTYIGDQSQYQVAAITTDSAANTYVTGGRVILPEEGNPSDDVFVTKMDASGSIVFTTTFGGKGNDQSAAIAVDPAGNIWVGGTTTSDNFPLHDALQATPGATGQTGFLVKLAQDGTVIYSSYFGGTQGYSLVTGVATDSSGDVYVTGTTNSSDFLTTPGLPAGPVSATTAAFDIGAFVTKLSAPGLPIIYSALISGSKLPDCLSCNFLIRTTGAVGIAVDGAGNALVAGNTNTTDLPVTAGGTAGIGAFAAKINAAGNALVYLTYLGQAGDDISATAIAADAAGDAYLTGTTGGFQTTPGAYQTSIVVNTINAFAIKFNPAGTTLWATYLGGVGADTAKSISLDSSGNVWLVGTAFLSFPTTSSLFAAGESGDFLSELSANGAALLYSAEFPYGAVGQSVAVDETGQVHVAGKYGLVSAITPAEPIASRILGIVNAAAGQFAGRIAPGEVISIFGFGLGPATPVTATPGSNGRFPTSLGGVQVLVNGAAIPLLYVSASQINAEIPAPLNGLDSAQLQVVNNSARLPDFRASVDSSIFALFVNYSGDLAAINQDGTVNSASNPAKSGSIVSIWGTGFGNAAGRPLDGAVATAADNWCGYCQISVSGGVNNQAVEYAGAAPGLIDGTMQINFMVPAQLGPELGPTNTLEVRFNGFDGFFYGSQ